MLDNVTLGNDGEMMGGGGTPLPAALCQEPSYIIYYIFQDNPREIGIIVTD
jgi:hypothetical protein